MANFDRGGRDNSRGGFRSGGNRSFDRDSRPKTLYDAICNSCGNNCQVPFRPTGEKPVFCRDCFAKQGGGRELGRQAGARGNGRDFASSTPNNTPDNKIRKQLEGLNTKLERLILAVQALVPTQQDTKFTGKKVVKKSLSKK